MMKKEEEVPQSYQDGDRWYRKAAEQGYGTIRNEP